MYKIIFKTLKSNHYIKNFVIFIPLIFSGKYLFPDEIVKTLFMTIAFCLVSSSVYIFNDLIDLKDDRKNPLKSKRPIVSGQISVQNAILILIIALFLGNLISYTINLKCLAATVSYIILNIFYSIWLKKFFLIDAACIALGFIFRILSGCFAINSIPSPLIIIMTFFLSNFFTFAKRKLEINSTKDKSALRSSLLKADLQTIDNFILTGAILSISFYITYVLDKTTIEKTGSQYIYLTIIPFTIIIYRLYYLISTKYIEYDPIYYIKNDKILHWLFLLYFIVLFTIMLV